LIRAENNRHQALDHGRIEAGKEFLFPERLNIIFHAVLKLLERSRPDVVAVEEVYVTSNAKTTLRLGHARGVILLAAVEKSVPIAEYAPREVKQAVVGNGGATKKQVQWMVRQILSLGPEEVSEDEADALAVALCHGFRAKKLY
jgi:crossover junction endodeoxyribonuclease RuvC